MLYYWLMSCCYITEEAGRMFNVLQEMDFAFGRALERIPITLVWGYKPTDNGSLNKVYEHTDAVLDPAVNFTTPEAQLWLLQLCQGLETWSQEPNSPIVINSVLCPLPLVQEIAAARDVPFPMPSEVRSTCFSVPSFQPRTLPCSHVCKKEDVQEADILVQCYTRLYPRVCAP
jgi:hypothetical protein